MSSNYEATGPRGQLSKSSYEVDTSQAGNVLGIRFRPFNEPFLDMRHAFMKMENAEKSPLFEQDCLEGQQRTLF
jgi:hypothetical protein